MRKHLLANGVLVCLLVAIAPAALAEIWGYVDEHGATHVAPTKLDDRYQLFYKGPSNLDLAKPAKPPDTTAIDKLRQSEFYQRVANSPNFKRYQPLIEQHAKAHGVDPALVRAIISVESAFDPEALSPKGALGLMQVIPETAARYGLTADPKQTVVQKLLDPAVNVRIGTRYLRDLLVLFANDLPLALAAYNAGEQAVIRHNRQIPPYPETREYVTVVQQFYALYRPPPPASKPTPSRIMIPPRKPTP